MNPQPQDLFVQTTSTLVVYMSLATLLIASAWCLIFITQHVWKLIA